MKNNHNSAIILIIYKIIFPSDIRNFLSMILSSVWIVSMWCLEKNKMGGNSLSDTIRVLFKILFEFLLPVSLVELLVDFLKRSSPLEVIILNFLLKFLKLFLCHVEFFAYFLKIEKKGK